ncbi:putative mitochondrial leishmanolysin-like protein [Leptomonas pyrrhocoris]|uniref:Leishmanolysin n=1 Tax=Leptomonas pyrrhocoris TaxID=157538 RepID=A0A0M9FYW6_LEPPY|nr:putative mitochondrial leishmanolysin-like protein [Leptomonas pyrrhocoris]KPA78759.1 putative mitochondrial leishmanolysin-like protein [Leptomonas pyrrhocoris]|eukprot:XP_015657198.1 putative mitochondrial leishmanolysin-like protein [Leptomonas pyrrhocoris]
MPHLSFSLRWCVVLLALVVLCLCSFSADVAAAISARYPAEDTLLKCGHDHVAAEQEKEPLTYVSLRKVDTHSAQAAAPVASAALPQPPVRDAVPLTHRIVDVQDAAAPAAWAPIRIAVFTPDLEDDSRYCTAVGQLRPDYYGNTVECTSTADILTQAKKDVLIHSLLPQAVQAHASRLMVHPVAKGTAIVVNAMGGRYCGSFTVPAAHKTAGVADADFVVYVAAGPTSTAQSVIAWALTCQWFAGEVRHPAVGIIYFNPRHLPETMDETAEELALHGGNAYGASDSLRRAAIHEMLHALGFTFTVFRERGVYATVPSLRGKTNVPVLNGTAVRAAAKAHYGLSDGNLFYGLELEDEGASGTALSHWKRRSSKDELMAAVLNLARYSRLSLAAMEDLGFYKAVYENAEALPYGYGAGIDMFSKACLTAGATNVPSVFCDVKNSFVQVCAADRLRVGRCSVTYYSSPLPSYAQYFTDKPTFGGALRYMDYCPVIQGLSNAMCHTGSLSVIPGSVISASSRCFDATNLVLKATYVSANAICARVHCDNTTRTYEVLVNGAASWLDCGTGGDGYVVSPSASSAGVYASGGAIACPRYEDVCYANPGAFGPKPVVTTTTTTTTTSKPNGASRVVLCLWSMASVLLTVLASTAGL